MTYEDSDWKELMCLLPMSGLTMFLAPSSPHSRAIKLDVNFGPNIPSF